MPSTACASSTGSPATAAAASACRNSRRLIGARVGVPGAAARRSLIDRRCRIDEQCDHVADLLLGQDAMLPEARHVRARGECFGVVDLVPRVLARCVGEAAPLAEAVERRADRAIRKLL